MQVSLFNGFADKNPKPITIREVVEIIRADQRLQVLTENHRRYRAMGDTARADAEKEHMPCYSVAVLFSGGKQQKHIVSYTGLSIVDLDHVPSERMAEVLTMVRNDPHTLLAYTTISGEGVRVLFRYAVNKTTDCTDYTDSSADGSSTLRSNNPCNPRNLWLDNQEYKRVFEQGNEYYSNLLNLPYDEKCKNATRLSGMAHDPEVYYNPRFLTDLTDNRRWLPFLVRDIDSPWTHPMPYDGMYSQAYTLYRTGFRYWFDADDNAELQRHNRQFEEPCMEEELIATYLRVPYGDEVGEFLTATRIIELIGGAVKRPLSAKKVALCMNRLGFEARRIRNVRGWNAVILTGNDIKEHQRLNAHRSVED